jgi:hypothetical protein
MASSAISSIIVIDRTKSQKGSELISIEDGSDQEKLIVGRTLGVKVSPYWVISDKDGDLAMAHVDDRLPPQEDTIVTFGHIHGAVVDTKTKRVIAPAYGYPQTAMETSIQPSTDGSLVLGIRGKADPEEIRTKTYAPGTWKIAPSEDGVVLRVFRYGGKVYHASHTRLSVSRSTWGDKQTFLEMYTEAHGPKDDELFDLSVPDSETVYFFVVVHPKLRVASRRKTMTPFVYYITSVDVPRPGAVKGIYTLPTNNDLPSNGGVVVRPEISLDSANNFLRHGFYPYDKSTEYVNSGEAVMVYRTEDGVPRDVVRVCGISYWMRLTLRGDKASIPHRYHQLVETIDRPVNVPFGLRLMNQSNPSKFFSELADELAASGSPFVPSPVKLPRKGDCRLAQAHNIHQLYVWSLPIHLHTNSGAYGLYGSYIRIMDEVGDWLVDVISGDLDEKITPRGEKIREIMTKRHKVHDVWDIEALRKSIQGFMAKEYPTSLHALDRQRRSNIQFKARRAAKDAENSAETPSVSNIETPNVTNADSSALTGSGRQENGCD